MGHYTCGINVATNSAVNNIVEIMDNTITDNAGNYGIRVVNEDNSATPLVITDNSIYMNQPYNFVPEMEGISITGCSNAVVSAIRWMDFMMAGLQILTRYLKGALVLKL